MYDVQIQNRYAFIRGKAKTELDTMLLPLANFCGKYDGAEVADFRIDFNNYMRELMPRLRQKAVDNWRTEILRSLFGLIGQNDNHYYVTDRCLRLQASQDQTLFFKEITYNFQFPFPSNVDFFETLDLRCRPGPAVIQTIRLAGESGLRLTANDLFVYVLNSFDVQRGKAEIGEIVEQIASDRRTRVRRELPPAENNARRTQHLREFLGYLELSNMLRIDSDNVLWLVATERGALEAFSELDYRTLLLAPESSHGFTTRDELREHWDGLWTRISPEIESKFKQSDLIPSSPLENLPESSRGGSGSPIAVPLPEQTTDIGRAGELIVLQEERKRLARSNPDLLRKLKDRSSERGIGFDIQSVLADWAAEEQEQDDFAYLEVKTTRRVTPVDPDGPDWISLTRNEWLKARDSGGRYFIIRVYLTSDGYQLLRIQNPLERDGVRVVPQEFRVDFDGTVGLFYDERAQ